VSPAPIHDDMAKAISDEELQLKKRARRRLVGAIALVLLVVVFLPMFLDSEPKPLNQDIAITIPPLTPSDPSSQPVTATARESAPPVRPTPAPEAAPKAETAKPEPKPVPQASGQDYVVQLGAFSNAANAKALQRKLQENKFKAYTDVIKTSGGERTRVRVGPYDSREAAEKARQRMRSLKLVLGDATVVRQGD
jgi:DedD protein